MIPSARLHLVLLLALLLLRGHATVGAAKLEMFDGSSWEGDISSIQDNQIQGVNLQGGSEVIPLAQVRSILLNPVAPFPELQLFQNIVYLRDGSRIVARDILSQGSTFRLRSPWRFPLSLQADQVRAILFMRPPPNQPVAPEFTGPLAAADALTKDCLIAFADGKYQQVEGTMEKLSNTEVQFVWQGASRGMKLAKVYGIVFAGTVAGGSTPSSHEGYDLTLADGSMIHIPLLRYAQGKVPATIGHSKTELHWESIVQIKARTDRERFLSDLTPQAIREEYFPSTGWTWKRDRAVDGQELALAGRVYPRGLGVHAQCVLDYELPPDFDLFLTTIGLPSPAGNQGDCVFVIRADGREVYRRRMTGRDAPVGVQLPVTGVKRLTLAVEAGDNFDIGDHAAWADARLLKLTRNP